MVTKTSPESEISLPEWMARFVADIPSAVAVFDRDHRYVVANNRWLNAFGIVTDGLTGQTHDQFDPHGAPTLAELHRRAMSGEAAETSLGHEDPLVDGGSHRVVSARPHRDQEGGILGVVATLHETAAVATEKSPATFDRRPHWPCRPPLLYGAGARRGRTRSGTAPARRDLPARHRQFQRGQRSLRRQRGGRGAAGDRQSAFSPGPGRATRRRHNRAAMR